MAKNSHAPDISERTIIDLSGRTATYYEPNKNKFDFAIGGMPFIMGVTDNTPYKRQTAPFRTERYDTERDPGEHTLAGSGYWIRSQSSWHYGDGIQFTEPMEGNDSEVRFRYRDSVGIDPWTPGQISLLKKTSLIQAFAGKCKLDTGSDSSGNNYLLATDMEPYTSQTNAIYKITSAGSSSVLVTFASLNNESVLATTSDGTYLYVATTKGVYDIKISDGTTHKSYNYGTLTADHATLKYVKSRIIGAGAFTNGQYAAYELFFPSKGSGASVEIKPTMTAADGILINGSTNMPTGWQWNCITESRNAIYLGGFSGEHSTVFKLQVDNTGALGTIVTTATLPRGEVIRSLYSYLGTYVMMGTNKGARVAQADSNGDLSYGPIVYHNKNGVYDFEARDSYVWMTATNGIDTHSGTFRLNLSQPLTIGGYSTPVYTGTYAKASDVFADGVTGNVSSVRIFGPNNSVAFSVEGSGVWVESSTELVNSGYIRTGRIRYGTLENKAWKRLRLRTPNAVEGAIDILRVLEDAPDEAFVTIQEGTNKNYDYDLASVFTDVSVDASFKLVLSRNSTDATKGAVVYGLGIKAIPTPTRARIIQVPLFCYDKETDKLGMMLGYEGYAQDRLAMLETLEATGETVMLQDFNAGGEPTEVIIEQVTFTRSTPAARNFKGFGGIIIVIARTVA